MTETEILGALDQLFAQLPDDAARARAVEWLRLKYAPQLIHHVSPFPSFIDPEPDFFGGHGGACACPQCVPPVTCDTVKADPPKQSLTGEGIGGIFGAEGLVYRNNVCAAPTTLGQVWVGETRFEPLNTAACAAPPPILSHPQSITVGGPTAFPSHVHVGSSSH